MGRLIRLDWAIKKILRDKANFEILEGFLSELLRFDILIQEILESESNQDDARDKYNRVDLLVKNQDGQLIIIEVQNESEADYLQRLMYGTSKAMVEHMRVGAPYAEIKKIYSVSIVYFDLGQGKDYLYRGATTFQGLRFKDNLALTDSQKSLFKVSTPSDLFPEYYLIKVPRYDNDIRDTLDEWIYFLKNEEIKDSFKAKGLQSAKEKLDILKMSEEERKKYDAYLEDLRFQASMVLSTYGVGHKEGHKKGHKEGHKKGHKEGHVAGHKEGHKKGHEEGHKEGHGDGLEEGLEKGEKRTKVATARRLLLHGMSPEEVAAMTELTLDEVKDIAKDL